MRTNHLRGGITYNMGLRWDGVPSLADALGMLRRLMVVLDLTVMNIALPSAQRALHFTEVDRQWVVTAYALAFGSLPRPATAKSCRCLRGPR